MLNNISWASYVFALSISLLIYYAFVLVMYYRYDLWQFVQQRTTGRGKDLYKSIPVTIEKESETSGEYAIDLLQNSINSSLLFQLESIIKEGGGRNFPKEELFLAIRLHLRQHVSLIDSNDKEKINNFIKAQCENYCSIHLSVEEERVLWII